MLDFLWAHPLGLAAMILGYVLLVFEFCIPGFGISGISGTILAILGIITLQPTPMQALVVVAVYVVLLLAALLICLRSAANGRLSRSRLVLNEEINAAANSEGNSLQAYVGKTGVAHTPLRPVGIAIIGDERLNVVSDCDFIDRGQTVRVLRAEGQRIVVARAE